MHPRGADASHVLCGCHTGVQGIGMIKNHIVWVAALAASLTLGACSRRPLHWDMDYVGPQMAPLQFRDMQTADHQHISASHYLGKVVLMYFGYTHCPDVCPLTMAHMARAIQLLGPEAKDVRILFVTVDPHRDTGPVLRAYVTAFSPEARGITGSPQQIKTLASRYHVAYSYGKPDRAGNYTVTHSAAIYVFDEKGRGQLIGTEATPPDQIAHDLKQIIQLGA
ncbi:Electron transport protein SCO1/SenC [Thiomonas sp. X19]|nr:Electron transport protein SCO1/SenC [Thiomonas sp. X19]